MKMEVSSFGISPSTNQFSLLFQSRMEKVQAAALPRMTTQLSQVGEMDSLGAMITQVESFGRYHKHIEVQ